MSEVVGLVYRAQKYIEVVSLCTNLSFNQAVEETKHAQKGEVCLLGLNCNTCVRVVGDN